MWGWIYLDADDALCVFMCVCLCALSVLCLCSCTGRKCEPAPAAEEEQRGNMDFSSGLIMGCLHGNCQTCVSVSSLAASLIVFAKTDIIAVDESIIT